MTVALHLHDIPIKCRTSLSMRVAIVHYHLAPGGVTTVIRSASQALTSAGIDHVILTGAPPPDNLSEPSSPDGGWGVSPQAVAGASRPKPPHPNDGLGYHTDPTPHTAADLLASLRTAATEALGGPPDLWHFHNHSLGKNRLLPEVISLLAEAGEHLVLQIHDLAEQGRPANYRQIAGCTHLYPFSPRIRYAFLNARDQETFTTAGLPPENSILLPNPIPLPASSKNHQPHSAPLRDLSDFAVKNSPAILFAPIRGIRRKNLGELVFLSALAPQGAYFAISRAPENPAALPVHDTWRAFVRKHHLPIEFDVVDHFAPAAGASADFESWLAHASHIVTTTVSEGFGLPFLESIAWGKKLIGRNLPHLTAEHARHGICCGSLYDRLLIPVDWVDLTILESELTTTLERNYRLFRRQLLPAQIAAVLTSLVHDDFLDFGNLPEPLQQGIIERLADKANRRIPLVEINGTTRPLEDWLAEVIANPEPTATPAQLAPYSLAEYQKKLTALYHDLARQPAAPVRHLPGEEILTAHLAPESFHFLLSALKQEAAPVKFRAVIFDIYGTLLIAPAGGVKPDPLADPVLREILRQAGYEPPRSPSSELHAAVLRHHASAGVPFPEIDLRILWREILSADPATDLTPLVVELETAWHPARRMPGAEAFIGKLSRSGISLGLLSNAQCDTLLALGDIADLFAPELTILSYQHGIAKPAPGLFQMLADRLSGRNISPAETLYIGNDPLHDIVPASAAGFRTALFTGHPDSFRPGDCQPDHTFQRWLELNALF